MSISRRRFLSITCRSIASIGTFGAFSRFGVLNAFAQAPDYKALVCVFLFGGNDGNNTVIPFDNAGYNNYATLRGGSNGVALQQSALLPIQLPLTSTPTFALHSRLTEIQSLFNSWLVNRVIVRCIAAEQIGSNDVNLRCTHALGDLIGQGLGQLAIIYMIGRISVGMGQSGIV